MPHPCVLKMRCTVINYGNYRKTFPTRIGNLFIDRLVPYEVCDEGVLEDLRRFEQSDFLEFKVIESSKPEAPEPPRPSVDYGGYRINELRAIAAESGMKGTFSMKKADLIKKLEEKNVTSV